MAVGVGVGRTADDGEDRADLGVEHAREAEFFPLGLGKLIVFIHGSAWDRRKERRERNETVGEKV